LRRPAARKGREDVSIALKDRFSGCLVGQCVGDALGFVVEGYTAQICARYVETELMTGKAGERGRPPYEFGQYTDDTQLTRELLESLVSRGGFDGEDYARRIADLFREDRIVGRGRTTEDAARKLIAGESWETAGVPAPAAGNGSAMRAAPVGLVFRDDPDRLIEVAHDQGRITHADPRCSAGAVAIAGAVSMAVSGLRPEASAMAPILADWAATYDADFAQAIRDLVDYADLPPDDAFPIVSRTGWEPETRLAFDGIAPFVFPSVLWSLYSVFRTPDDYWQTICTAIAAGGDVDTTAAMAGAISGAYLGINAVPADLASRLNDNGTWTVFEFVALAENAAENLN
jgi:ADP-ribosylglycohydrolase